MKWFRKRSPMIYYVSGVGNDRNLGTHPTMAWATIARVNRHKRKLKKGDTILFERGFHYSGTLHRSLAESRWITIGAYGSGDSPVFNHH